jgi:4-methyl-5(b-hydroxyethyl)-thiazole monophosphate biosynthesis
MAKSKRILIIITDGVEDIEFITIRDICIRSGIDVDVLHLSGKEYTTTSYNLQIKVPSTNEIVMNSLVEYIALYIPGGPQVEKLMDNQEVKKILAHFYTNKKVIGAMCAAPAILAELGYLVDVKAICYPSKK